MLLDEKKYVHKNVEVTYLLKEATSDKKHLVVIFTGFMAEYNFLNIGKQFKCNVLWIKDSYEGLECYYLGKNSKIDFAQATNALIESVLATLSIKKSDCTLLGGSKGGYGALYIGILYQYTNIISCAPMTKIGQRLLEAWPEHADFIMADIDDNKIQLYDNLLDIAISEDVNVKKNIYLFVSESDIYYNNHQKPLIQKLRQYDNFNLINIKSNLVYQHNKVTAYCVPLIISFVNALIEGIVAKFGYIESGFNKPQINTDFNNQAVISPLAELFKHSFNGHEFYITGVAFFTGISVYKYKVYKKVLIIKNKFSEKNYTVGTVLDRQLSKLFFREYYVDYTAGGFANLKGQGIDLSDLELGVYQLNIEIEIPSVKKAIVHIKSEKDFDSKHIYKDIEYRLWTQDRKVYLSKRLLIEPEQSKKEDFNINLLEIKDSTFFISGHYSILGIELENWREANYYVVFSNSTDTYSYRLGMEHKPALNDIFGGFGVYQKSAFATLQHQGISLDDLTEGEYNISLIISYKGTLIRKTIKNKIIKKKNKPPIIL